MKLNKIFIFCSLVLIFSCDDNDSYKEYKGTFNGFKPIYMDTNGYLNNVKSSHIRPIISPGKIYIYNNYLFINELGSDNLGYGVHCFDNSDPDNPEPISFIEIPYNNDILIKNNTMYCQSPLGLVYFDITDLTQLNDIKLLRNPKTYEIPPFPSDLFNGFRRFNKTYFECIDNSKGIVVGWKQESINNPKCYK